MKNERKKYALIWLAATTALFMVGLGLAWLFDDVLNGYFREWVSNLAVNAGGFRRASVLALFLASLVIATTGLICASAAANRQRARERRRIADYVRRVAQSEAGSAWLGEGYGEIEGPLSEMRMQATRAQRLAEAEIQRKSDLITYLAHDLKTPLSSVIAYLNLLSEAPELDAGQRVKFVEIALDKAYRLEQLIDELFEIVRFNLHAIAIDEGRIHLKFMLEQLADEFYPILLPQGKKIRVSCAEGLVLRGDADKLARVFNNILKNAAAYSYEDTEITIEARQDGKDAEILFINRGDPIPPQKREAIFEKFYRLDAARSTKSGGTGLGLAIAKEIVDAHCGAISVSSDAENTVFRVNLPGRVTQSG